MAVIIGVKFRCASKLYYFDPLEETFEGGDRVIVETARGVEMGKVVIPNREVPDEDVNSPLKPIIRKATERDLESEKENKAKEPEAFRICKEKIRAHELEMKLVAVEYTFDGSKVLFYFTADGRVDFRELVKDLASTFRTRIELRQIGVRDEAKIKGGIGICGRPLCCSSYLCDFVPVSIKMAKEQNLSLNPTKISGCCGRLMCCLKNEEETYEVLNSQLPSIGDAVTVRRERVKGIVQSVNVLRQRVRILVSDKDGDTEVKEYPVEELLFVKGRRTFPEIDETEELLELEALEEKEEGEQEETGRTERPKGRSREPRRDRRENADRPKGERKNRGRREENAEVREQKAPGEPEKERQEQPERRERKDRKDRPQRPRKNRTEENGQNRSRDIPENNAGGAAEAASGNRDPQGSRENRNRRNRPPRRREEGQPDEGRRDPEGRSAAEESEKDDRPRRNRHNRGNRRRPRRDQNGPGPDAGGNEE